MTERDDAPTGCDAASIEALFRAHYSRLCDFVNCYVRSPETASDLVQDLFVHLWERCDAGDVPLLTTAYLYTAARNRALKHLRHRRVVARWAERVASAPLPTGPQADERLRTREMAEAIRRAIDALPDRCRQIFLLSREKYLSYAEIAEVLGSRSRRWKRRCGARSSRFARVSPHISASSSPLPLSPAWAATWWARSRP